MVEPDNSGSGCLVFPLSYLPCLLALCCGIRADPGGAVPVSATSEPDPLAGLIWESAFNVRLAPGYKDNISLSGTNPEASSFWLTGFDISVFRLPVDGTTFSFLFSADDIRYLDATTFEKEQSCFATAEVKREFSGDWGASLGLLYNYIDSPFDASSTESGLAIVEAVGHGFRMRPAIDRHIGPGMRLELGGEFTRQLYEEPLDHYWDLGPRLALLKEFARASEVSLEYQVMVRAYDTRLSLEADGSEIEGEGRRFLTHRVAGYWTHHLDSARIWRSQLRFGIDLNTDNGGGYFDYNRPFLSEQLRYHTQGWDIRLKGGFGFYDYQVQRSEDPGTPLRRKLGVTASLNVERQIWRKLRWFFVYEYEQSLSTQSIDEYQVNSVYSGIDWEL
jgi:hypothetical protein